MYDPILLHERMAELGLNYYRLGRRAKIDPKTAKKIVLTGAGQPDKVAAIAKVLKFKLPEIVKRQSAPSEGSNTSGKRRKAS